MAKLLFGTAGWSYEDWKGRVYPGDAGSRFDPLAYLAEYFDLVEVNSTFYRLPDPKVAKSWLRRTRHRPDFLFLLKVPRDWTHGSESPTRQSLETFRALALSLAEAEGLGALLIQFPWSFRNEPENRGRLADLLDRLSGLPVAVEVRHGGFEQPEWFEWLRASGCIPVNIDQPCIGDSLPLRADTGTRHAYFRFHGRNESAWFDGSGGRDARYDWLYTEAELAELGNRIEAAKDTDGIVFVVTNNHFLGQAAANALQLKFRFTGRPLPVPPTLRRAFPQLEAIALPSDEEQGELF